MIRALLLVFSLWALPAIASPEKLLNEYFAAIADNDFRGFGNNILPDHLAKVKRIMVEVVDSKSPAARALEVRIFNADVDAGAAKKMSGEFYVEQLTSFLNSEAGHMSFTLGNYRTIGEVTEGVRQRHILVRLEVKLAHKTESSIRVFSFSKQDGRWYMEYPPILKGYLDLIEQDMSLYR